MQCHNFTKLGALMTWVEGPFRAFWTLPVKNCTAILFFWWLFFLLSRRQYTIKPRHIRHLLGTYIPNDEDVSLLEQIADDKGRFSDESDRTLYGSANHVEILRRNSTNKITNSKHDFASCLWLFWQQTQLLASAYLGNELVILSNWQWCDWHNVDDSNVHFLMGRRNDVKIL